MYGTAESSLPFLWEPPSTPPHIAAAQARLRSSPNNTLYHGLPGKDSLQEILVGSNVFTAGECEAIVRLGKSMPMWEGQMIGGEGDYRRCRVSWLDENGSSRWIYDRLRPLVLEANKSFDFEISGFCEPLHFLEYPQDGRIDWHTDIFAGPNSTRKISVSVQLSPRDGYEGGELELCPQGPIGDFTAQGDVVIFPAYIPHRVLPIRSGMRHALIAWIHGPAFR